MHSRQLRAAFQSLRVVVRCSLLTPLLFGALSCQLNRYGGASASPFFTLEGTTLDNSNLYVEFYTDALEIPYRSEKEGRPVFETVEMVRIMVPGDMNNIIEVRVTEEHKQRYAQQYARFKAGEEAPIEGTPLEQWPLVNKAQIKEAQHFNVRTVEQVAELSDSFVAKIGMGWQGLRKQAQNWLKNAKDGAVVSQLTAENERMKQDIADLKEQIARMGKKAEKLKEAA